MSPFAITPLSDNLASDFLLFQAAIDARMESNFYFIN